MSIKIIQYPKSLKLDLIQKFDPRKMYEIYDQWPELARIAYESDLKKIEFKPTPNIVFAGMGGSGTVNDIFTSILSSTNIHASSIKSHLLPNTVNSDTLVIVTSISGNTQETLSVLESAREIGCRIMAFSSGGRMEQYCKTHNLEYRKISMKHSPRCSFISFLYSMIKVLSPIIPIDEKDVYQSLESLNQTKKEICSQNLTEKNQALDLAKWMSQIPLIYYPQGLRATAIRFKNSIQENAKMHVIREEIGEASHNGIVSWELPSQVKPILLRGIDDHAQTKQRWAIFKEYFGKNNIDFKEIFSVDGSLLSKLVNLIYLLDYSTIYRAILSGVDPSPIESTQFVKQRL